MLTIRLQRRGKKNQPFFKIIVTEEKNSSTRGRSVEELGFYNPLTKERSLNGDRAKYWMSVGAQPSDTVYNMLVTDNVIEGKKRLKHKKSKKKEQETETTPKVAVVAENAVAEPAKVEETPESQPKEPQLKTTEPTPEVKEEPKKDS
ncbi:30S ribosomal protein S16 [Patescibacteria group bacterium]|nr:30S ribosomal protein S16 [Patescibacteria group bacterium]